MKITVPASALRLPGGYAVAGDGEESKEVTPEVNDPVSFHVEGIVTGRAGDNCEVEVRFVNGERPTQDGPEAKKKKPAEKSEAESLRESAMEADEE